VRGKLFIINYSLFIKSVLSAKVIGIMRMLDEGHADDKIIAVAEHDMSVNHYNDISELLTDFLLEMRHFFEEYRTHEKKTVELEDFQGA